ncbi:MAG: MoxR family ATPase [Bacteroidia bacterium]|nr:MoxR family ATPase [Bacteroidia bacterium]
MFNNIHALIDSFEQQKYIADEELGTILFLMLQLGKPVLLEGNPGVGKTEVANVLSKVLDTELIRLQCYEGLDVHSTIYEWNYQKQLLSIKIQEQSEKSDEEKEEHIFGSEFLLKRPLLKAITASEKPPVLLIDEIDRADEEFEAFLLELLSAFQISIPEMGTVQASHRPWVILTSNRTRELGDALKRRCLYHWVNFPSLEKEMEIIQKHLPNMEVSLVNRMVKLVQYLRTQKLDKAPGIAESLDWARGLLALGFADLDEAGIEKSLGCLLKSVDDIQRVKSTGIQQLLTEIEA